MTSKTTKRPTFSATGGMLTNEYGEDTDYKHFSQDKLSNINPSLGLHNRDNSNRVKENTSNISTVAPAINNSNTTFNTIKKENFSNNTENKSLLNNEDFGTSDSKYLNAQKEAEAQKAAEAEAKRKAEEKRIKEEKKNKQRLERAKYDTIQQARDRAGAKGLLDLKGDALQEAHDNAKIYNKPSDMVKDTANDLKNLSVVKGLTNFLNSLKQKATTNVEESKPTVTTRVDRNDYSAQNNNQDMKDALYRTGGVPAEYKPAPEEPVKKEEIDTTPIIDKKIPAQENIDKEKAEEFFQKAVGLIPNFKNTLESVLLEEHPNISNEDFENILKNLEEDYSDYQKMTFKEVIDLILPAVEQLEAQYQKMADDETINKFSRTFSDKIVKSYLMRSAVTNHMDNIEKDNLRKLITLKLLQ